jgi:hypothetical protein
MENHGCKFTYSWETAIKPKCARKVYVWYGYWLGKEGLPLHQEVSDPDSRRQDHRQTPCASRLPGEVHASWTQTLATSSPPEPRSLNWLLPGEDHSLALLTKLVICGWGLSRITFYCGGSGRMSSPTQASAHGPHNGAVCVEGHTMVHCVVSSPRWLRKGILVIKLRSNTPLLNTDG